jgi:hypothetical protein
VADRMVSAASSREEQEHCRKNRIPRGLSPARNDGSLRTVGTRKKERPKILAAKGPPQLH